MKTLILFHRLQLTDLFAPLADELVGKINVVHLAYGSDERDQLLRHGVVERIYTFKDEIKRLWQATGIPTTTEIEDIDKLIIEQTKGAFNLNGAIQSDRAFCLLSYSECLKLTAVYYRFWKEFLARHDADYVMHEPTSLMMNFLAAILCSQRGAQYIYQIMAKGDRGDISNLIMSGFEFNCPQLERNYRLYANGDKAYDQGRCDAFIDGFRTDLGTYLGDKIRPTESLARLLVNGVMSAVRQLVHAKRFSRCTENIDYWDMRQNTSGRKFISLLRYVAEVTFHEFKVGPLYYYYPLHLEPEAVVLYHGHGLYRNQVKLIENIAAQLPPNTFLYVKDHPHDFGYRSADDFKRLQKIPNVRLIRHNVSGKLITAHAVGVITITGTAGFEALLLGKQIYTLSKTFYGVCPRVKSILHVRDIRDSVYVQRHISYDDDVSLYHFVAAYLDSINDGLVDYFVSRAKTYGLDLNKNAKIVAQSILKYVAET